MPTYYGARTGARLHFAGALALALASTLSLPGNASVEEWEPETRIYT